jgi:ubiquinone/menaquinone biosynthesis C-methylase UbiE
MSKDIEERLDDFLVKNFAYFNYENYVKRLYLKENEKVLEIGCGSGNLSRFLAKEVRELVCIDNSEYWIREARKRLRNSENILLNRCDILDFDKENYFDVAIVHYVLHDIPEKEMTVHILNKCLNSVGRIYIREPTRNSHGISSSEIEKLMCSANFSKIKSQEDYSFPLRGRVYEGSFRKIDKLKS